MNKKILIFVAYILLSTIAFGQQDDKYSTEYKKQAENQLKRALKNASPEVKQFHQRLGKSETANETESMIFSLGSTGNKCFTPYLKALMKNGHCKRCIEVVLVQLCETSYVKKAISDVDSRFDSKCSSPKRTNNDRFECHETNSNQDNAIWKLARFKTKEAYQKLYELLDDTTNRNFETSDDSPTLTKSWHTINQLCGTVENPPLKNTGIRTRCASDIATWKAWFEASGLLK